MRATLGVLGAILSILSVVMLIRHGFDAGFAAPLLLLLQYYQATTSVLLGWVEPLINGLLASLNWPISIHAHWRDIFILMCVVIYHGQWNPITAIRAVPFTSIWSCLTILLASLAAGAIRLDSGTLLNNFLIVEIPVVGYSAFLLGRRIAMEAASPSPLWHMAAHRARMSLIYVIGAALFSAVALLIPPIRSLPGPGVVTLLALVALYALLLVRYAGAWARWNFKELMLQDEGSIGVAILAVLLGALIFMLTNAGLTLAGL